MELRDYLQILGQRFLTFAIIVVIFAVGFYWYGTTRPETFEATRSLTVIKKAEDGSAAADFYKFDDFYTIQASGLYSDIITGWLQDPSFVQEVYRQENLGQVKESIKNLSKRFLYKKSANGVIQVIVNDNEKTVAEKLINGLEKPIRQKTDELLKEGKWNDVVLKFSPVLILAQKPSVSLYLGVGFFVGIIFGLIMVFLIEYFQTESRSKK